MNNMINFDKSFDRFIIYIRRKLRKLTQDGRDFQSIYRITDENQHPGPYFEELDASIGYGKSPASKVIAFYLPQFYEFEENNKNWGNGFTEWTNLSRNIPRFRGHIAPRIPRDLGFYNLTQGDIQRRQVKIARDAGIYGFCYYYYRFDGRPFMQAPLDRMLGDPEVNFPFCLMWCNETWTKAWIDRERSIIAEQKYSDELDRDLASELSRYFSDPRYIRIDGRPLFIIYRPSFMLEAPERIEKLRTLLRERHGFDVLLTMAQTDAGIDPEPYGLDGAIEFTANKFNAKLKHSLKRSDYFDLYCADRVFDYDQLIDLSVSEPVPTYPLARAVMPHWDKNPRRPGRAHVIHGSTPIKFENWTKQMVEYSLKNPFFGDNIVFVNAWNEWAEGAYLEPDVYYGGAYLNSIARAVFR